MLYMYQLSLRVLSLHHLGDMIHIYRHYCLSPQFVLILWQPKDEGKMMTVCGTLCHRVCDCYVDTFLLEKAPTCLLDPLDSSWQRLHLSMIKCCIFVFAMYLYLPSLSLSENMLCSFVWLLYLQIINCTYLKLSSSRVSSSLSCSICLRTCWAHLLD